jgi:fimbrial chaperone protein
MFGLTEDRKKQRLMRWFVAAVAVGVFVVSSAHAVTISPVKIELTPTHRVEAITVTNDSDSAMTLQAETLEWTQPNGEDREKETDDLLVVPPLAEIKPGNSQIFRVKLRRPALAIAEHAYRLVLDDVSEIKRETEGVGVTFNFSHRLPVFVVGTGKIGPKPRLGACASPAPSGCVRLDNEGDRFVQVNRLTVEGGTWHKEMVLGNRVLAGAWKQWTFDWPANYAGSLTVNAETSAGPLSIELPAERR